MIHYVSTRGNKEEKRSAQAIIQGIASDKGLFVPEQIPPLPFDLEEAKDWDYKTIAQKIISSFFNDFSDVEMRKCIDGAYTNKFDAPEIAPMVKTNDAFFLELYHGRTSAFKDMALSILPYLLTTSMKKEKEDKKIVILTATSGDTGKAALEGFSDVPGTEIIVFYPNKGVSKVQEYQMITQEGNNTHVYAIEGNFDDAQTGVKRIFNDTNFSEELGKEGYKLSSANSINIGRLIPQVAYYVYAYLKLIKMGEISYAGGTNTSGKINVTVPTGNFGNILAAYYAREMGVPINKLICASNVNKVLTDFINTGTYDTEREFHLTNSPSMDILISSNLERLLYHLSGCNANEVTSLMSELDQNKKYTVNNTIKDGLQDFVGGYASIEETNHTIGKLYKNENYLVDTHTAVAYKVYEDYRAQTGDTTPTIIAATASPYKFAASVANSIGLPHETDDFKYVEALNQATGIAVPKGLADLENKKVRHSKVIKTDDMINAVRDALNSDAINRETYTSGD